MRLFPLSLFPKLSVLIIWECENLESLSIEGVDLNLSHLSTLSINDCPELVSFSQRIHTLTALEFHLQKAVYFCIQNLDRLRASVGEYWGLQGLVSLEHFTIGGRGSDDFLEMLLKEQLLPYTLHSLRIWGLSSLKSLDGRGLGHLTSLQELYISEGDSIQFMPEEGFPPFLLFLRMSNCSGLEKRYENIRKMGQDWANISHIPCLDINDIAFQYFTLDSQIKQRTTCLHLQGFFVCRFQRRVYHCI